MHSKNFPLISSSTQISSTPTGISSPVAADRLQFHVKNQSNSPRKWNPKSKRVSATVVARAFGLKSSPVSMAKDAVSISRSVLQTSSELSVRVLKSLLILVLINEAIVLFLLILPSPSQKQRDEKQKPFRKRLVSVLWKRNAAVAAAVEEEVAARRAIAIRRVKEEQQPDRKDDESLREFSLFVTSTGQTLFTQSWTPLFKEIRGLVVVLHGLNEHSDRYSKFAKELNANGYKVYAMDWIGHGGSDGLHAYIHSLDEAVMDTKSFIEKVLAENPGVPCFCFGHSTGAAIVLKAVLDPKVEACIAGVVLTSPAVVVQASHPIFAVLAPVFSLLIPRYQFGAAKRRGIPVSRDPDALVAKYSDPLVYTGPIRIRTGYEILRISTYLQKNLRRLKVALLVLHGTADTITDPKGSRKLYEEAASTDKTIRLFEGFLHDLLFEPEREREIVVKGIIDWLNSRRVV